MRKFILFAIGLALTLAAPLAHAAAPAKPNILFILVDDFGARDLSCYGSRFYQTVNMDRLAKEGVSFTQAYVAYPRCVPSRYAMMTGKYPARTAAEGHKVRAPDVSVGKAFQDAGYTTVFCGKWHLGDKGSAPAKQGFSQTIAAGAAGAARSHFAPYNTSQSGSGEKFPILDLDDAPKGEYLTDRLTDETIKFIKSNKDKPFFAVLAHYAVHQPIEAKKDYTARYRQRLKENPPSAGPAWEKESAGQNKLKQDDPVYAAMIHSVDEGVGRILDMLKELKIDGRTIVVLASDHGGLSARGGTREVATSNRPLRAGKGHLYEGGIRIPLIVKWPGVTQAGTKLETPVIATDLYPTFLQMAGLPLRPEQHLDGKSFAPLFKGAAEDSERVFFWHNPAPRPTSTADLFSSAIRCGNYKLVDFYADKRLELYDLSADPEERKNLASSLPETAKQLHAKLDAFRKEINAPMPTETPRTKGVNTK